MRGVAEGVSIALMASVVLTGCEKQVPPPPPPATVTTGVSGGQAPGMNATMQSATAQAENALPPGHPQIPAPPPTTTGNAAPKQNAPPSDPTVAEFAGMTGPKPVSWQWNAPVIQFSVADYSVPGTDGTGQASIRVTVAGGTLEQNINRWKLQFQTPEGKPVEPLISNFEANGMAVTLVELKGEYRGMGPTWTPDTLFLTAVVQGPAGQTFVKFTGPTATVERNREAFMTMIKGLHKASE
ncbi:MAG TPA: hypothetical protein VG711_00360 [Phycisphaerales bacterium]|nr:hypothetical protein [Phycisphaerales bacterium]